MSNGLITNLRKNRTLATTLLIIVALFLIAIQGMTPKDWVITVLRGLSVGAVTFLVASGFSLIFGLLDVLNLAHGTLFMLGAFIGWTILVRPDTFVDVTTPAALIVGGLALTPVLKALLERGYRAGGWSRVWPWLALVAGAALIFYTFGRYPITKWDPEVYANSPVTNAFLADQGQFKLPAPLPFKGISPAIDLLGMFAGSLLFALGLAGLELSRSRVPAAQMAGLPSRSLSLPRPALILGIGSLLFGLVIFLVNTPLTVWLFNLNTSWRFLFALVMATAIGVGLGGLMESTLIRPLYSRPIYQLMLTMGLSAVGIEAVRALWGRPEFTMPKPALFSSTGAGCPASDILSGLAHQCSTILVLGGRVRMYNEIFIPLVGLIVLISVWLLLQRTRIGMIIRAGVQDREMVEALGINVRQVFTLVFALGVGLAVLGGVLAGPSMGLSSVMGENVLLNALIALAIGGLTSFPGAAAGSILLGLLQQFIIKYGQIGIHLPFIAEPFKPTPPLVPASTVLLMVIVLLILPQGLFGRKE